MLIWVFEIHESKLQGGHWTFWSVWIAQLDREQLLQASWSFDFSHNSSKEEMAHVGPIQITF